MEYQPPIIGAHNNNQYSKVHVKIGNKISSERIKYNLNN